MPGRKYPGVAVQLDSLGRILVDLSSAVRALKNGYSNEALEELEGVHAELKDVLEYAEQVFAKSAEPKP